MNSKVLKAAFNALIMSVLSTSQNAVNNQKKSQKIFENQKDKKGEDK